MRLRICVIPDSTSMGFAKSLPNAEDIVLTLYPLGTLVGTLFGTEETAPSISLVLRVAAFVSFLPFLAPLQSVLGE